MTYYKKHYLIGIYAPLSEGETLLALVDNIKQFSELMQVSTMVATNTLNRLFKKEHDCIRFRGRLCSVEFINTEE